MSALSVFEQGAATSAADQYQAERLQRASEYGKVAAKQTAAQGLENLNTSLGQIDAVRAAGNVDPTSPTTAAIKARTDYISTRDTNTKVANIMGQVAQNKSDAAYLRDASGWAMTMGEIGAGAKFANGFGQMDPSTFGFG